MGVGPVLNLFVSLCVNRSLTLQFRRFSKPGDDLFFWESVQNLTDVSHFDWKKINLDRVTSFMALLAPKRGDWRR